jgi:hypothetical protein
MRFDLLPFALGIVTGILAIVGFITWLLGSSVKDEQRIWHRISELDDFPTTKSLRIRPEVCDYATKYRSQ